MSIHCSHHAVPASPPPGYRKVLWAVLVLNAMMCLLEVVTGLKGKSVSLLADAIDFGADAANYGISLFVLQRSMTVRAKASLFKALCMLVFGIVVTATAARNIVTGNLPDATTMGVVGVVALLVNIGAALLLYRYRQGDSNMLSVWLCTRNDAIGNIGVLVAALLVTVTDSGLPDALVALAMGLLAVTAGWRVALTARQELRSV